MKWERDSEYSWVSGEYRIIAGRVMNEWRFVLLYRDGYIGKAAADSNIVKQRAVKHDETLRLQQLGKEGKLPRP